ncbi:hypothetical protein Aeh1ORF143c [Aeromonas phage Aeh1]|uniref:Uncharacterized protein n=1 Tax=Aeromonas phage Aeh1 TaxID=2880362 RepID=Q76YT8_9CAUD|nr:hypothetical protein Aeh1p153 [Aeromonas phage Aeh1]AAQ17808.1 hypothetical protein Aeh1ORF143c [Aeromonas phage Aeh1]
MNTKATDSIAEMLNDMKATFRYRDRIVGTGNPKNVYAISQVVQDQQVYHVCFFDLDGKFNGRYLGRVPLIFLSSLQSEDTVLVDVDVPNENNCDWVHIKVTANSSGISVQKSPVRIPSENMKELNTIESMLTTHAAQTVLKSEAEEITKKLLDLAGTSFYNRMVIETRDEREERLRNLAQRLGVKYVLE